MAEQQREHDNYQTSEVSEQGQLGGDVWGVILISFTFFWLSLLLGLKGSFSFKIHWRYRLSEGS